MAVVGSAVQAVITTLAVFACGHSSEPAKVERPARDAAPADTSRPDAATPSPRAVQAVLAQWSSEPAKPGTPSSPACIVGGGDRFVQYADLDEQGALRFCLWWNLGKQGFPDVGCWHVDLATGRYVPQVGVWFSTPQPPRVGIGGGRAAPVSSSSTVAMTARWRDDGLEVCRDAACKRVPVTKPAGKSGEVDDVVFDDQGHLAVVPLGRSTGDAKARIFAAIDVVTGSQIATLTIADRHRGAEVMGFVGPSLLATDCDDKASVCAWDLYDPRTGAWIAAVGGATALGAGGTAVAIDAQHFAAVAATHLVIQDAATGTVTARIELPRAPSSHADYVVFLGTDGLVVPGPDGRVVLVDPGAGKLTRTITAPRCVSPRP